MPAVVDLAAMRDAMARARRRPETDQPAAPGRPGHRPLGAGRRVRHRRMRFRPNAELEYERNQERYAFLRWGQQAFAQLPRRAARHRHLPPGQPRVPRAGRASRGRTAAYPDTLVGTDSHTTMVNGLGVVGWGVGGIEAEAAHARPADLDADPAGRRLQADRHAARRARPRPTSCSPSPRCCARRAWSASSSSSSAPASPRCRSRPRDHRQHGARVRRDHRLLPRRRRDARLPALHRPPAGAGRARRGVLQGAGPVPHAPRRPSRSSPTRSSSTSATRRAVARRPEAPAGSRAARRHEGELRESSRDARSRAAATTRADGAEAPRTGRRHGRTSAIVTAGDTARFDLRHGAVVIAAITSCTNTSNPAVLLGAGLLAKKAVERGLDRQAVGEDLARARLARWSPTTCATAGLMPYLEALGFHLVGYGCTTCIGNSGPLPDADRRGGHATTTWSSPRVLSGNRNFEGRINPQVRTNYLASPPLVVAYALAGDDRHRPRRRSRSAPTRTASRSSCKDIWPTSAEVREADPRRREARAVPAASTRTCSRATSAWQSARGARRARSSRGTPKSTYVRKPPFFDEHAAASRPPLTDVHGARVLALLGDSVTTDHISPAGNIAKNEPGGAVPDRARRASRATSTRYGARRGNHEVMMRGTFANIRLKNLLLAGVEGGVTRAPARPATQTSIYDAAMKYAEEKRAARGDRRRRVRHRLARATGPPRARMLLGVRAVIAKSFERIHRSNLVGMGVLPLQFDAGRGRRHRSASPATRRSTSPASPRGSPRARSSRSTATGEDGRSKTLHRHLPHRYAERGRLLPARRHPAVRAAPAGEAKTRRAHRRGRGCVSSRRSPCEPACPGTSGCPPRTGAPPAARGPRGRRPPPRC